MYTIYNENNNIKVCTFNDKNLFLSRVLTSVSEFVNQSSYAVLVSFLFLLSSMNQEQVHLNIQLHSLVINSINWNVLWVTHFFCKDFLLECTAQGKGVLNQRCTFVRDWPLALSMSFTLNENLVYQVEKILSGQSRSKQQFRSSTIGYKQ